MTSSPSLDRRTTSIAAAILVAAVAVYANGLTGAFVFDDVHYVAENKALRTLWPPYGWLGFCPTRPVVYFTFAVNYALHQDNVVGYHVVNLAIHLTTALALFGLIRRTLRLPCLAERYRDAADAVAMTTALLWVVHPLCTQAVTYIYQRIESAAAMFVVLTLYAFVRADETPARLRRAWYVVAIVACYAAMLCKESAFALPLLVLCYDRLFLAGSWRGTLVRRRLHSVLFCTWGVVLGLMLAAGRDYERAGIGAVESLTPSTYALNQSSVLLHYLRLAVWPVGLCLDDKWPLARNGYEFVPQTLVVLGLLACSGRGLIRGRLWSFPACAFFLLLAPTSSFVPIADLAYEHRMYLPLAAVLVLIVCGAVEAAERIRNGVADGAIRGRLRRIYPVLVTTVVIVLGVLTMLRNRDYRSYEAMWRNVLVQSPHNERAYANLASDLIRQKRSAEAREYLARALDLNPHYAFALWLTAGLHLAEQDWPQAERYLLQALQANPDYPDAHNDLGLVYFRQGRESAAAAEFLAALEFDPLRADARTNLGVILIRAGRIDDGLEQICRVVAENEDFIAGRISLGIALAQLGRLDEAAAQLEQALELDPSAAEAREKLIWVRQRQAQSVRQVSRP